MQWLTQIFTFSIVELYTLTGSLGWAIVLFTLLLRSLLFPLSLQSQRAMAKMRELQPELDKLKGKHGKDKKAMQQAQLELYQKNKVNPLAGCIPQIVQLAILIFLYTFLLEFLAQDVSNGVAINPVFFWLDLRQPDAWYVLPVLAGVTQLVLSLMMMPVKPEEKKSKKAIKKESKKEVAPEGIADMAQTMQKQMVFMLPLFTAFIALSFPSGLSLYWVITTVFSIVQQYYVSGFGGMKQQVVGVLQKIRGENV
ncbi:MAG: YidC/Oxa1 family membrane protein insertase [bacterium]|nr:YidC/Oxa1 family membrane protein insertase [bacterium]